ncbi:neurotransmitter-gated ion-channel ligand binding domain-containing protein [Ditylenchus destructor]|uniref:Neurotransmitter-gated ion-channel ligand binding domain-containing protein n=1 Tax=Ditylenchus destructor TaxID=166010 RepID=A0AAD4QZM9_9BILA|nr:neurotransmitter-gated ion-channel ligand binding domain-containing protein [Ditylenchus destructor]
MSFLFSKALSVTSDYEIFGRLFSSRGNCRFPSFLPDLRKDYDRMARPVVNHFDEVNVTVSVMPIQLLDLDISSQQMELLTWTQLTWNDYRLKWDPRNYSGLAEIRLPSETLWKPDVFLYNSVGRNFDISYPVNIVVKHTGDVLLVTPAKVTTYCPMDLTRFPNDEHLCWLKYGSWSHSGKQLNLAINNHSMETGKMELVEYSGNGKWELVDATVKRTTVSFQGEKFVDVTYYMRFRRKLTFERLYWILLCFPFLIINALSFMLSPERRERLALQALNVTLLIVYLGFVINATSMALVSVPRMRYDYWLRYILVPSGLITFLILSAILCGLSIFGTLIVISIGRRSSGHISPWMKRLFFDRLPRFLCMDRFETSYNKSLNYIGSCADNEKNHRSVGEEEQTLLSGAIDEGEQSSLSLKQLEHTVQELRECIQQYHRTNKKNDLEEQWHFIARVVDRVFFYVCLLFSAYFILTLIVSVN